MSDLGCSICQENFTASATCVATKCGHVFHKVCVSQWITNSRTCPSCRAACSASALTRLYFTTSLGDQSLRDIDSVTDKLLAAQESSARLQHEVTTLKTELTKLNDKQKNLKKLVSTLDEMNKRKDHILKYNELQMKDYEAQRAKAAALSKEVAELSAKVDQMSRIETILNSSVADAEELTKGQCSKTLAFLVVNLKRELAAAEAKKNEMFSSNCSLNNRVRSQTNKIEYVSQGRSVFIPSNRILLSRSLEDKMKSLETEFWTIQNQLRARMSEGENRRSSVPRRVSLSETIEEIPASPPVVASKQSAEPKEESPYLRLASSSVGLAPLMRKGTTKVDDKPSVSKPLEKLSIFQRQRNVVPFSTAISRPRITLEKENINQGAIGSSSNEAASLDKLAASKTNRFKIENRLKSGAIKRPAPYQPK